jgi:hypothetical protein
MSTTLAATPTLRQAFGRLRFWLIAAAVVVLLAIAGLVAASGGHGDTPFAADNPGPRGAEALRSVLEQQGVRVTPVGRTADVAQTDGTLLVDDTDALLPASAWRTLITRSDRLVVVQPSGVALQAVLADARAAGYPTGTSVPPGCGLALARRAGSMSLAGVNHSLRALGGSTSCFRDEHGAAQLLTGLTAGTRVILLADAAPFENGHIGEAGNAAVALNVLGARSHLTWYRPDPLALAAGDHPTLQSLTPAWVTPLVLLLGLSGLAAAFWRGRRLGPLVVERLPVIVRTRETVEGRARLYQRAGARVRAADALRIGTIGRIAPLLGLSRTATVDEVAVAAATATRRPLAEVRTLLVDRSPATDAHLVRLSDDLGRFEAAVDGAVTPSASRPTPAPPNGASR